MTAVLAEPPEIPRISAFSPSADLIREVDFFLGRVGESLATPAAFDLAAQSRLLKDSNALAALLLMLAVHDERHALSASSPAMLAASRRLAMSDDNYERAKQAFDEIKSARANPVAAAPPKWQKVASLSALMKQVPLIHTTLKRGVEPSRLARQAPQSAAHAAALAAIAQASLLDTEHVRDPADVGRWRECCVDMRDAAAEVNSAVHAADSARVAAGMKQLLHSCDTCHEKFRQQ